MEGPFNLKKEKQIRQIIPAAVFFQHRLIHCKPENISEALEQRNKFVPPPRNPRNRSLDEDEDFVETQDYDDSLYNSSDYSDEYD